jgi:hypothetical protein
VDDKGPIQAYHPINQQKTPNQWIPFTFNWNLRANMTLPQISWLFLIPIKKHPSFERLRKNNNNKKKKNTQFYAITIISFADSIFYYLLENFLWSRS